MTTETGAPAGSDAAPADEIIVAGNSSLDGDYSPEQAYADYQKKFEPAESADAATAEPELAEANADPETDPGETETKEADPEAIPPIERPRSWAKELDEEWASYPREAQEKIAKREQERDAATRRSQNEAADARKAAEAVQAQAEQARKQYETAKLDTVAALERDQQRDFPDIRNMDDVRQLQSKDPFRFQEWQIHQMALTAAVAEKQQIEGRQAQEKQGKRSAYEAEQNKLLVELVPEMADPKKAGELREQAVAMLTDDLGLKTDQLSRWMADDVGHEILSNAGIQKLIADQLKSKAVKAAPAKAIPKPVPAVQRPGVAAPRGNTDAIQASRNKLNSSGSPEDAYSLYLAKQKARA